MTENLKRCPFCGSEAEFNSDEFGEGVCCKSCGATLRNGVYGDYGRKLAAADWNARPIEGELLKKYENALLEICFCCAAVDCSLEQQSESLKAIDKICTEFYSIPEEELRGKNERR